jgi:GntR family transcriptional regulator
VRITLTKESDVPLRDQLAEQIVFLITTGQLRVGQELPSVRALARRVNVHHNTVSEAYRELVRRNWLVRRRGSRLTVRMDSAASLQGQPSLDELINESIQRAREMGYSLQVLKERVRERLLAQPPDHVLVVEQEKGLREIIRQEIHNELDWPVETCSWQEFAREPGLAIGAQVIAPNHIVDDLKPLISPDRPIISLGYRRADEHIARVSSLKTPSIIVVASVSESLLKTARSLLAAAVRRKHTFKEFLLSPGERIELESVDLAFCDSVTRSVVSCRNKIHYRLIASDCLEHLAAALNQE